MSNPIVINPTEVVALSERMCLECVRGHGEDARIGSQTVCGCDCHTIRGEERVPCEGCGSRHHSIGRCIERLGASGNQARLNNGCVCNDGCPACDALAEAFEAMREALVNLTETFQWLQDSGNLQSPIQPHPYGLAVIQAKHDARAALALAAKVKA